jgi:hypothetical protein
MRKISMIVAAVLAASPAYAVNLIANGDFEAGNTGFASQYTYTVPGPTNLYPESTYTVDTNPINSHDLFSSFGDHTSGEGNFMIINGAGVANEAVWISQPLMLAANTSYTFAFWLVSVHPASPAQLEIQALADGPSFSFGPFTASGTTGVWQRYSGSFNTGGNTTPWTLNITNLNTELSGNDFGIDDISLTANAGIPEPGSWAMLVAGFGLTGFAARRRRQSPPDITLF